MHEDDRDFKDLGKRISLEGLPPDLLSQLQFTKMDELEEQVMGVVDSEYQGMANIDEIMVGLFRKFGEIQKRPYLSNKLYRMAQSGLLFSVKGKKGVYTTKKELEEYYRR